MGNTPGGEDGRSGMQDKVAFVEPGQQHRAEEERPDAVVGLLEADVLMCEGVGDIQEFGAEPTSPKTHLGVSTAGGVAFIRRSLEPDYRVLEAGMAAKGWGWSGGDAPPMRW